MGTLVQVEPASEEQPQEEEEEQETAQAEEEAGEEEAEEVVEQQQEVQEEEEEKYIPRLLDAAGIFGIVFLGGMGEALVFLFQAMQPPVQEIKAWSPSHGL